MANSSQQPALTESSANNKRKGKNPSHVTQSPNMDLVTDDNVSCTQAANIANTHAMTIREYLQVFYPSQSQRWLRVRPLYHLL